jgi:ABC-type Mn2+/Zn2+ transport system ATPase subunit
MQDPHTAPTPSTASQPLYIKGTIAWHRDHMSGDEDAVEVIDSVLNPEPPSFRLQNLDITFPRAGQITLIAGKFGSGKTLLLLAMLGEAHLFDGSISYCASDMMSPIEMSDGWDLLPAGTAYVPQMAWLQSQSIR